MASASEGNETRGPRYDAQMRALVLDAMADRVACYAPDQTFQWANRAVAESVGMTAEALVGRPCREVWQGRDGTCDGCPVPAAREAREPCEGEMATPDGRVWALRAYPVLDEGGRVTALVAFGQDVTERKRMEEDLKRREAHFAELTARLTRVEEHSRYLLAADLHDDVAQVLSAAKLKLRALEADADEHAAPRLAAARGLVDAALEGIRRAVLDLGPPVLYELDLAQALGWLIDRTRDETGAEITFESDEASPSDGSLPEELRVALFRAARELLTNAVRHACPTHVHVALARADDEVRLSVDDDGSGFDPKAVHEPPDAEGGFGLFGVRERMVYLGGRLEIESSPRRGARATVSVPIRGGRGEVEDG